MDNTITTTFRTGVCGFNKDDVIRYIVQSSQKTELALREKDTEIARLEEENLRLKRELDAVNCTVVALCKSGVSGTVAESNALKGNCAYPQEYDDSEKTVSEATERAQDILNSINVARDEIVHCYSASEYRVHDVLLSLEQQMQALQEIRDTLKCGIENCADHIYNTIITEADN